MTKTDENKNSHYSVAKKISNKYKFIAIEDNGSLYIYDKESGKYEKTSQSLIEKEVQEISSCNASNNFCREVIGHIKRSNYIKRSEVDDDKSVINVKNGLLDINTLKLYKHSHKYYSITQLPIKYDKDAECPNISKFFSEIVSKEDVPLLEEYLGFVLIPEYLLNKAFMLVGSGANGKTMYLDMIRTFIGDYNCSTVSLQDLCDNRFASSQLWGMKANICDDIQSLTIKSIGKLKMLTGHSMMMAERKGIDGFDFRNKAKMIFACNEVPKANDADNAYYHRWLIVKFHNKFDSNNKNSISRDNLFDSLTNESELSGLLNLALKARKRIIDNNSFSRNSSEEDSKINYIQSMDSENSPSKFISSMIGFDVSKEIAKSKLYIDYNDFCNDNGLIIHSEESFHKTLKNVLPNLEEYKPNIDGHRPRMYRGIYSKYGEIE